MIEIRPDTKFLIVSDDPENALAVKLMLKKTGLNDTTIMNSGIDALKHLTKTSYDLLIVDINTRFISGWHFIKEFKTSDKIPNMPAILIGEEDCPAKPEQLKQYGVPGFLKLPIIMKDAMSLIAIALSEIQTKGALEYKYAEAKRALIDAESKQAVQLYSDLHTSTSKDVRSSIGLAQAFEQSRDFGQAASIISEVAKVDATNATALQLDLKIKLTQQNFTEAEEIVTKLIKLAPDSPVYYLSTLDVCLRNNAHTMAENICTKAIKKGFNLAEFHVGFAKVKYAQGDIEDALKRIRKVKKDFGASLEALNLEGICLRKQEKYDQARSCYEQALKLSPMDAKVYFNLAITEQALKNYDIAQEHIHTCLKIAPKFQKAKEKLQELKGLASQKGA